MAHFLQNVDGNKIFFSLRYLVSSTTKIAMSRTMSNAMSRRYLDGVAKKYCIFEAILKRGDGLGMLDVEMLARLRRSARCFWEIHVAA